MTTFLAKQAAGGGIDALEMIEVGSLTTPLERKRRAIRQGRSQHCFQKLPNRDFGPLGSNSSQSGHRVVIGPQRFQDSEPAFGNV